MGTDRSGQPWHDSSMSEPKRRVPMGLILVRTAPEVAFCIQRHEDRRPIEEITPSTTTNEQCPEAALFCDRPFRVMLIHHRLRTEG